MHGRYVTDILKMCMKKLNAEKIIVWTNLQGFDLHIAGCILKPSLQPISCCHSFKLAAI